MATLKAIVGYFFSLILFYYLSSVSLTTVGANPSSQRQDNRGIKRQALRNVRTQGPLHPTTQASFRDKAVFEPSHSLKKRRPLLLDSHPRNRPVYFDVLAYYPVLDVQPQSGHLRGCLSLHLRSQRTGLRQIELDAAGLQIQQVSDAAGKPLAFSYDANLLTVDWPTALAHGEEAYLKISYQSLRSQALFVTGPDVTNPTRIHAAYTYSQPEGSQHWFPCLDRPSDKALLEISITVPNPFAALSNGQLLSLEQTGGKRTYTYRMEQPIAPYLISLVIGTYEQLSLGTYAGKPLTLWSPTELSPAALIDTAQTAAMMASFSNFTGHTYPFASYTQAVAPAWGPSMEHQTATTLGSWRIRGDRSGESVVAHELAHQWFGDWLTCESWSELWLNEGFASYLPAVYYRQRQDLNQALEYESWWREGYFAEAKTGVRALSSQNLAWQNFFDAHAYEKGALVLNLMRYQANRLKEASTGEPEAFSLALKEYSQAHGGKTVRSRDLQQALEKVTQVSWQKFFSQWVLTPGHPKLKFTWSYAHKLHLELEQSQAQHSPNPWATFAFPLEAEVLGPAGQRQLFVLEVYNSQHSWDLELGFTPVGVNLDPDWVIPAEITAHLAGDALLANWLAVWRHSPLEKSRLFAMSEALKLAPAPLSSELLQRVLDEASLYVQAESLTLLTTKASNYDVVRKIWDELSAKKSDPRFDVILQGVLDLTSVWLLEQRPCRPTAAEIAQWQRDFKETAYTSAREAAIKKIAYASLETAQLFALERLQESRWVTKDRQVLIDILSQNPSALSLDFIKNVITEGSLYWYEKVVSNLIAKNYQNPELIPLFLQQAEQQRYDSARALALTWLGLQQSSGFTNL